MPSSLRSAKPIMTFIGVFMCKTIVGLFCCSAIVWSAVALPQSKPIDTSDELQIYRTLLQHYPLKTGDLIGLLPETVPFPAGTPMVNVDGLTIMLRTPVHSARSLPSTVTALVKASDIIKKLKAQGEYVPRSRRPSWTRPDGFVQSHLALSDIAFSFDGQWAALAFSANCGCKGGEGGIAVFHKTPAAWQFTDVVNSWTG